MTGAKRIAVRSEQAIKPRMQRCTGVGFNGEPPFGNERYLIGENLLDRMPQRLRFAPPSC